MIVLRNQPCRRFDLRAEPFHLTDPQLSCSPVNMNKQ